MYVTYVSQPTFFPSGLGGVVSGPKPVLTLEPDALGNIPSLLELAP